MGDLVTRTDAHGVATLTLNRPNKLNALSVEVFRDLREHVEDIGRRATDVAIVVLRGSGRCFSAGHDLGDLLSGENLPHPHFQAQTIEDLANLHQPVIAAVHGHCYTGALELALAADILLCTESARFADTHAKWAVSPIWGLSQRLPRRVGVAKAREMMLTCATYTGEQASAMGLANTCVPDADFDVVVAQWCARIQENSAFIHAGNKRLLAETDGMRLAAGLAHEIYRTPGVGPDMQQRISAFLSKGKFVS